MMKTVAPLSLDYSLMCSAALQPYWIASPAQLVAQTSHADKPLASSD
jgi:hypothetical protein